MRYSSWIILVMLVLGSAAYAQLSQTGMGKVANGGVTPGSCTGTIDGTEGCPLPMLGL